MPSAIETLGGVIAASGLVGTGTSGVALISGGADSAGLLAGLAAHSRPHRILALHLDYGLREESRLETETCAELCELLGVELVVELAELKPGNLQAVAREARYEAAERLRAARSHSWIATGHTRTDLAETVIYRLASSPGTRALLGLQPRRGLVIRPLLELGRAELRSLVGQAELPYRDDPSNAEPIYARNRVRNEVMPVLEQLSPATERVIAETRAELAEDHWLLEQLAIDSLERVGVPNRKDGAPLADGVVAADLAALDPALRRRVLRVLAERCAGRPVALGRRRADQIVLLGSRPTGGVVELGGGVEARVEQGRIRFVDATREPAPSVVASAELAVPGRCSFGEFELSAEPCEAVPALTGQAMPGAFEELGGELGATAVLDRGELHGPLTVRGWRDGDRIRPLGLNGSKSLQDLFTDRKVPRSLRRRIPVVTTGERIAWVAGVEVSEEFKLRRDSAAGVLLRAVPTMKN